MSNKTKNQLVAESLQPSERELMRQQIRYAQQQARQSAQEAATLRKTIKALAQFEKPVITPIGLTPRGTETTAIAILQASDWHVEEIVDPRSIAGYYNKYNPRIAKQRANNFFRIGQRLIDIVARDLSIDTIIVPLLGDFITNELHEDSAENNAMAPTEAAMFAQDLIASGLAFLLEQSPKRKIHCVCHTGNHGRITKRVHHAKEHGHSLEYMMYVNLAKLFEKEDRITFDVSLGYHSFTQACGIEIRMHHGHAVMYHGGIGGITIPVNKAIAQWDKAKPSGLDLFGHFHTLLDGRKWASNGSLIGYSAYSVSIKAEPEPPAQWFHVIDSKRGRTYRAPIYVERG